MAWAYFTAHTLVWGNKQFVNNQDSLSFSAKHFVSKQTKPFLFQQLLEQIRLVVVQPLDEFLQSPSQLLVLTNVPLVIGFLCRKLVLNLKLFVSTWLGKSTFINSTIYEC